jgi:hypothetical protein
MKKEMDFTVERIDQWRAMQSEHCPSEAEKRSGMKLLFTTAQRSCGQTPDRRCTQSFHSGSSFEPDDGSDFAVRVKSWRAIGPTSRFVAAFFQTDRCS